MKIQFAYKLNESFAIYAGKNEKGIFHFKDKVFLIDIIQYTIFSYIIRNNGLFIHSSCSKTNGSSIIFPGESHSGKSTLINLIDGSLDFKMLHDDLTCVYFEGNNKIPFVQPFPFLTPDKISPYCNKKFPLKAIFFLNGKGRNTIKKISKVKAFQLLIKNIINYKLNYYYSQSILDTSARIVEVVPCYTLSFKKDPSIANLILKTLDEI